LKSTGRLNEQPILMRGSFGDGLAIYGLKAVNFES